MRLTKRVREGETAPLAPKRKRQERRRDRKQGREQLQEWLGQPIDTQKEKTQ